MALARKGSRRIVVDDRVYRWQLRTRPTYVRGLCWAPCAFAVEAYDRPGRKLIVTTNRPHPSNWMGKPSTPVLPREIARAVRLAVGQGWDPSSRGAPFRLDQSADFR